MCECGVGVGGGDGVRGVGVVWAVWYTNLILPLS